MRRMTATPRPFRFGIQASTGASRADWVSLATRAEANGFSTLTMPDHFGDQLAPVPAMQAAQFHRGAMASRGQSFMCSWIAASAASPWPVSILS